MRVVWRHSKARPATPEQRVVESADPTSSPLDAIADVPIVRSDSFRSLSNSGSGHSMQVGDVFEMVLPAVLIGAALYFGNRVPHGTAPYQPITVPSLSSPSGGSAGVSAPSAARVLEASPAPRASAQPDGPQSAGAFGSPPSTASGKQVVLSVEIDEEGFVTKAVVLASLGSKADAAAVAAIRNRTFKPTVFKGKPVPSILTVRYP
jgi:TonB family protein